MQESSSHSQALLARLFGQGKGATPKAKKKTNNLSGHQETAAKTKAFLSVASVLMLPISGAGPLSW